MSALSLPAPRGRALLLVVVALDLLIHVSRPGYALLGLLDEPAHLATGAIVVAVVSARRGGLPRSLWVGALCSTVLIDLDHLPSVLGSDVLTAGTPRPYTHSLTTVLCLGVSALATRRHPMSRVLQGCVIGVSAHLLRDVATAPIALVWPLSNDGVAIPYVVYLAVLAAATVLGGTAVLPGNHAVGAVGVGSSGGAADPCRQRP